MRRTSQPARHSVRHLDLYNGFIGDEGAKALAKAPLARNLRTLVLARNLVHAPGLRALAKSPHLRHLRELDLHFHGLEDAVGELAEAEWMRGVEALDLSETKASDRGVARLVASPLAEELLDLFLSTPFDGGRHQPRVGKLDQPVGAMPGTSSSW